MAASGGTRVLTFRAPGTIVRALDRMARRQRQTRSEVMRGILEDALRPESRDRDPARESRRQSLLASRGASEREALEFVEQAFDDQGWQ